MWQWQMHPIDDRAAVRVVLRKHAFHASVRDVLSGWENPDDADNFGALWRESLRALPFEAYFWETPPLTRARLDASFECVFVDAPALARTRAERQPFSSHFAALRASQDAVVFANQGRDAMLVAPAPRAEPGLEPATYPHLAAFMRHATPSQIDPTWHLLAETVQSQLAGRGADQPLWISTSGLGVYWLHFRIDTRPKYYQYDRYTRPDFWEHAYER